MDLYDLVLEDKYGDAIYFLEKDIPFWYFANGRREDYGDDWVNILEPMIRKNNPELLEKFKKYIANQKITS